MPPMPDTWTCLMYHEVPPKAPGSALPRFGVLADTFRQHLTWLARWGLRGGSVAETLTQGGLTVAITFDDGTIDHYEQAFPILREFGMSATFYVVVGAVGRPGYASWNQLRLMRDAGMSIQSHSLTHPFLSELSPDQLWRELTESRRELDDRLGQETSEIAFPGGDPPRRDLFHMLADAGYRVAATSRWGINRRTRSGQLIRVRRCTVKGAPSELWFGDLVRGRPLLHARQRSREMILGSLRRALGPTRYARLRRRALAIREAPHGHGERQEYS